MVKPSLTRNSNIVVVQLLSCVQLFVVAAAHQPSLSFTISLSLLKLISGESMMPSNHLIFNCSPTTFPPIRVFCIALTRHINWPNYWSFSFSISPSNEYSGLISFRIDWFDLLAVQGTLRVFSSTTAWKHQFFGSQPSLWSNSHIIALTRLVFVGKVLSLLFNTLSRFVTDFFPPTRSKNLNFMAVFTICSDFRAQGNSLSLFMFFYDLFAIKCWGQMPWSSILECYNAICGGKCQRQSERGF